MQKRRETHRHTCTHTGEKCKTQTHTQRHIAGSEVKQRAAPSPQQQRGPAGHTCARQHRHWQTGGCREGDDTVCMCARACVCVRVECERMSDEYVEFKNGMLYRRDMRAQAQMTAQRSNGTKSVRTRSRPLDRCTSKEKKKPV